LVLANQLAIANQEAIANQLHSMWEEWDFQVLLVEPMEYLGLEELVM
jgi:hypothetical protein